MKVGFIGLGNQGGPMAQMIHRAGFDLRIWARRAEVCADYRRQGIHVAADPAMLAADCDAVCLCVTGDDDVYELSETEGLLQAMRAGSALLIHSTVSPQMCEQLARAGSQHGVMVVDAPVSGSGEAALNRRLLVLVGGEREAVRLVRPVLESYGDPILHVGAVGDGQRAKIVNNLACIGNMALADLALQLGESVGLDRGILRDALLAGSGRSFALGQLDGVVRPSTAGHVAALFEKDLGLAKGLSNVGGTGLSGAETLVEAFLQVLRSDPRAVGLTPDRPPGHTAKH
ncbi:NAD(P)-dependent oxidoreductase [[Mycobacterium] vasticus]|uniref:NAD(P)-dependent oxidoreductase n=1 Tax=[Mycobacterium] vasticus TaxID=2875777 RepID=A0ABU5YZW1_9MYCO|nr:NAD(P)-dependent oxidoreductase [Mycolicibacter sp. MYC017]MEB3070688.1 NAD(P)-dependent oxidoreductase [Mycolicibacter sp. MYC017]